MNEPTKKRLTLPVVVEGKYDKITLSSIFDGVILTTGGFSVFNAKEKQALFRKIAGDHGLILLTDSDGGGKQIRKFLSGILPKEKIHNLYIPQKVGKEPRKDKPSKAGFLGVEGMDRATLEKLFAPFIEEKDATESTEKSAKMITKVDFFEDKLTGCPGASERRAALARQFSLPADMTANALLEALNLLCGFEKYKEALAALDAPADR